MAIINHLKDIRIQQHLSQEELALAVGSCSRTISRIERGERNPSLEMALRLTMYLNVRVEDIFMVEIEDAAGK